MKERNFKKNDELVVQIEDMGNTGEGIGHAEGYALFVKGALPGEKVRVRLMKCNKNYGFAKLLEILTPSPDRILPKCPVAGRCGGCSLQHMSYEGQLRFKEKKVFDCLTRIGGVDPASAMWLPIMGMNDVNEEPWQYRNKAQFPVRNDKEGNPVAGFFAGRTHAVIPVSCCEIQHPVINEVVSCVLEFMRRYGVPAYDEERHCGLVRHIYIRRGYHTGQIMVCLVLNGRELPHDADLIARLRQIDGMTSICLNINTERTNVILGNRMLPLWGSLYIEDRIGDLRYRISPQSFYQVNPVQTEKLYAAALSFAELSGTEHVWDLYCGIGTISLFLSRAASSVSGVEIVPEAVENARANAALNGVKNVRFACGAAEDVLPEQGVDVIVVDPPRKGCDAALLATMVKMQPKRIVYVSCDPATLARDVKVLGENGYGVQKVQACDMFPQGGHVECVVLMTKVQN